MVAIKDMGMNKSCKECAFFLDEEHSPLPNKLPYCSHIEVPCDVEWRSVRPFWCPLEEVSNGSN